MDDETRKTLDSLCETREIVWRTMERTPFASPLAAQCRQIVAGLSRMIEDINEDEQAADADAAEWRQYAASR
jgi:hypothetical protein